MNLPSRLLVLCLLAALCAVPAGASTTIVLQNGSGGYAGTTDAWLDASQVLDNHGGAVVLQIRWNNGRDDCALVKFDLAGRIPSGAAILSATLSLYYAEAVGFQPDDAIAIRPYRLQEGASWDENVHDGQPGAGVSYRYRDVGETREWTGGAAGGWWDKVDDGNGSARIRRADGTPAGATPPQSWVSFDVTNSVVQWKAGAENDGFLLVAVGLEGTATACDGVFTSRDDPVGNHRPRLTITYEAPVSTAGRTWGRIKALYR